MSPPFPQHVTNLIHIQTTHNTFYIDRFFGSIDKCFHDEKSTRYSRKIAEYCEIKGTFRSEQIEYILHIWQVFGHWPHPIFVSCVRCPSCCCIGWERGFVQKAPAITPHITTGSASFWQEMAQYLVIWTHRRRPRQRTDLQMKTCLSSHNFFLKTDWNQKVFIRLQSLHFREGSSLPRLAQFLYNSVFNGSFNVWETKM